MEQICLEDRKKLVIKGATRVVSSTSTQAVVEVSDSNLTILGHNIEVTKLDLDNKEVVFSGKFNCLKYTQKNEKQSLLKRIFK